MTRNQRLEKEARSRIYMVPLQDDKWIICDNSGKEYPRVWKVEAAVEITRMRAEYVEANGGTADNHYRQLMERGAYCRS